MEQSKPTDSRVQEGLSRIEYLDCMLKAKMQREKQVKRQGRDLRRQLHMQLLNAIRTPDTTTRANSAQTLPSQHSPTDLAMVCAYGSIDLVQPRQEIMQNIERFFASEYHQPPGCPEEESGIDAEETNASVPDLCSGLLTDAESLGSHKKVFSTECNLDEKEAGRRNGIQLEQEGSNIPERSFGDDAYNPGETDNCPTTPTWTRNDKDYVQRNIELAAKAGELLPRTAEEEDRLEELLADTDESHNSPFGLLSLTSGLWSAGNEHHAKVDVTQVSIFQHRDIAQELEAKEDSDRRRYLWSQPFPDSNDAGVQSRLEPPPALENASGTNQLRERMKQIDDQVACFAGERHREALTSQRNPVSRIVLDTNPFKQKRSKLNRPGEVVLSEAQQTREDLQRLNEINQRLETIQQDNFQQMDSIHLVLDKMHSLSQIPEREYALPRPCATERNWTGVHVEEITAEPTQNQQFEEATEPMKGDSQIMKNSLSIRCKLGKSEPNICAIRPAFEFQRPFTTDCLIDPTFNGRTPSFTLPQIDDRLNRLTTKSFY